MGADVAVEPKDDTDLPVLDPFTDPAAARVELAAWCAALERTGWSRSLGVYLAYSGNQNRHQLMLGRHDGADFPGAPEEVRQEARVVRAYLLRGDDPPPYRK